MIYQTKWKVEITFVRISERATLGATDHSATFLEMTKKTAQYDFTSAPPPQPVESCTRVGGISNFQQWLLCIIQLKTQMAI